MTQTLAAKFSPGSMIKARSREWVVLPESTPELLLARPVGGLDEEVAGILPAIEKVEPASFGAPDPSNPGNHFACRLLRDAARLSTRAAAGPFRSFGRINVEPRPYQLVPLLMALKLDPIRLLVADDVGIGKTVEACLIARELIDRGEIKRMAVLCPPHLAEQWQRELAEKFHIDAELVLSSTIQRLERGLRHNESVFDRYPFVIVSMDYIKQTRRRDDFIRACPELVIVDEAHTCTVGDEAGKANQQRHELLRQLSESPARHLILVTATPHSGNEHAFRSLLGLLDASFRELPDDLDSPSRDAIRRKLAQHLIQRRRGDIRAYLDTQTTFPQRLESEDAYALNPEYRALFEKILRFARGLLQENTGEKRHQRVRWWSVLALLRALASSPAAAAATLRNRAVALDAETEADIDELGGRTVFDRDESDEARALDLTPGADASELSAPSSGMRARLLDYAKEADDLLGAKDGKLQGVIKHLKQLVRDGCNPIVFCRFIDTADYVAQELRLAIKGVEIVSITGMLPPQEREARIAELAKHPKHILVCTDCLSEGINLQNAFDTVIHYDLSWNPTRHEQREGRVDRYGQPKAQVRVLTYYGKDNGVDGVVLDVLLRKHKKIKSDLGISVAVPGSSEDVLSAIFEGLLMRENHGAKSDDLLPGFEEYFKPRKEDLHSQWDVAVAGEKKSRSRFAQNTIDPKDVAHELKTIQDAIGTGPAVEAFVRQVLATVNVPVTDTPEGAVRIGISLEAPRALRQAIGEESPFAARFQIPVSDGERLLVRTSPAVEGLAAWVMDTALDPVGQEAGLGLARRCGVTRTKAVPAKTILLLVRNRYHLLDTRLSAPMLAEEIRLLAFTGPVSAPVWIEQAQELLEAQPTGNVLPSMATQQLEALVTQLPALQSSLNADAKTRGVALLASHQGVRTSLRAKGTVSIEPVLPVDVLGCYIFLPEN